MAQLLLVAASERELVDVEGAHRLACGIGPAEAALATAGALAAGAPGPGDLQPGRPARPRHWQFADALAVLAEITPRLVESLLSYSPD
jgi:hypothetical protein